MFAVMAVAKAEVKRKRVGVVAVVEPWERWGGRCHNDAQAERR